jgi:uncharacterized protein (TIGR03083 family)
MLDYGEYLAHLDADAHLLGAAAALGLEPEVPSCPGWTVADLLRHVTRVHASRVDIVSRGLVDGWPPRREPPAGIEPTAWYRSVASELSRVLAAADPTAPAITFVEERTVGFWMRRMAHETLVHRVDAEQAHGYESFVDPALAIDGVAELLEVLVPNFSGGGEFQPGDEEVTVATGDRRWMMQLGEYVTRQAGETTVRARAIVVDHGSPQATLSGDPDRVMLWLWGRAPLEDITIEGDREMAQRLRAACSI